MSPGTPASPVSIRSLVQLLYANAGLAVQPRHSAAAARAAGGDVPFNEVRNQRLFRLINGHPNDSNYFRSFSPWQSLAPPLSGSRPGDRCLPPYLQRSQFAAANAHDPSWIFPACQAPGHFWKSCRRVDVAR